MESMATMDHYSIYVALLQTPVEGPGFADVVFFNFCTKNLIVSLQKFSKEGRTTAVLNLQSDSCWFCCFGAMTCHSLVVAKSYIMKQVNSAGVWFVFQDSAMMINVSEFNNVIAQRLMKKIKIKNKWVMWIRYLGPWAKQLVYLVIWSHKTRLKCTKKPSCPEIVVVVFNHFGTGILGSGSALGGTEPDHGQCNIDQKHRLTTLAILLQLILKTGFLSVNFRTLRITI